MLATIIMLLVLAGTISGAESVPGSREIRTYGGVSVGTPAGLNVFLTQYVTQKAGFRISGGFVPGRCGDVYGVQAGPVFKWKEHGNTLWEFAVFVGYAEGVPDPGCSLDPYVWRYVGGAMALKWRRLFVELGWSAGTGSFSSPQLVVQLGLVLGRVFR